MTDCSCACHIGGFSRPPCDVVGGCGPHGRTAEPICPGPCNNRYLTAEAHEFATGEPNRLRPNLGAPVWCARRENDDGIDISCTANIRAALVAMPELYVHLHLSKAVSTPDKHDRHGTSEAPAASREVHDQDETARWLWDWSNVIAEHRERHREADKYQPFPVGRPWGPTLAETVAFIVRNYDWTLTHLDRDLVFNFGDEVLHDHRRLTNATKTGNVMQHRSAPCPRCQRRTLVHELGTKHVACTNKECGRLITLDEYDELVVAYGKSSTRTVASSG